MQNNKKQFNDDYGICYKFQSGKVRLTHSRHVDLTYNQSSKC